MPLPTSALADLSHLLAGLAAFLQEHRGGELDGGADDEDGLWIVCECGATGHASGKLKGCPSSGPSQRLRIRLSASDLDTSSWSPGSSDNPTACRYRTAVPHSRRAARNSRCLVQCSRSRRMRRFSASTSYCSPSSGLVGTATAR